MTRQFPFYNNKLDTKVHPQDDLFAHANNPWIKANPIPAAHSAWGTFNLLHDNVQHQLKKIVEKLAKTKQVRDPGLKLLREYYLLAIDEKKAEELGTNPVMEELARIDAIDTKEELLTVLAHLHYLGVDSFWEWAIDQDEKKNTEYILQISQGGLGMPDRDYYLNTDKRSVAIRKAYLETIAKMLTLAGWNKATSTKAAQTIFALEKKLAAASMTRVERRDIPAQYNKMSITKLESIAPGISWKSFFDAAGISKEYQRAAIVAQPKFMAEAARIIKATKLDDLKLYLSWQTLAAAAPYLNKSIVETNFAFYGITLSGVKEMRPRWKRALSEIDGSIGEILGKQYIKEYFPKTAQKKINTLVDDLFAVYRSRISSLPWMSVKTMAAAITKLDAMRRKIAFPTKWETYKGLKADTSSYLAMHWAAAVWATKKNVSRLGKPLDRTKWHMTPQTVNAYCDFVMNEIVFPAGILQKPFFDASWPDALNYGSIGAVIGHELTHAFDDQGAQFDAAGNLKTWWTTADKKKFAAEAKKLATQYSSYVVVEKMRCNGELTLGENIADIGGVAIAYDALARRIGKDKLHVRVGKHTPAQAFFIAYAQGWGGSMRPEEQRQRLITDPHAPAHLRVNAALPNLEEFHEAFGIQPEDKLYRKPEDRVSIW